LARSPRFAAAGFTLVGLTALGIWPVQAWTQLPARRRPATEAEPLRDLAALGRIIGSGHRVIWFEAIAFAIFSRRQTMRRQVTLQGFELSPIDQADDRDKKTAPRGGEADERRGRFLGSAAPLADR
jgi:hypothetical protein